MLLSIVSVVAGLTFGAPHIAPVAPATPAAPVVSVAVRADSVQGRILTANGEPVADALVTVLLNGTGDPIRSARSGADGTFTLAMPSAPGTYVLRVRCLGYSPVAMALSRQGRVWNIPSELTMTPIEVNLAPMPVSK